MRVKVNDGYQLGSDDGKVYQPGEEFNTTDALAYEWVNSGQAVEVKKVKAKKPPKVKMVAESKNKAVTSSSNKAVTMSPKAAEVEVKK